MALAIDRCNFVLAASGRIDHSPRAYESAAKSMLNRPTLREALRAERPLVTPLAHDALSARLIARAGFKSFAIGGSALLASRYALPDIGLIGLGDMAAAIRDIAAATPLPFLADGRGRYRCA